MVYLDNAATTFPKPKEVYGEIMNCMNNYAVNPEKASYDMAIHASAKILETRRLVSKFFNIKDTSEVFFTSSSAEGLSMVIKGLLRPRDHVITTVLENESILKPLNVMKNKGINITFIGVDNDGYINENDVQKEIRRNTKIIIISHASNVLGSLQDIDTIGRIANKNNVLFMVDASQTAGSVEIDVQKSKIDILAASGHKGLFGPQGIGLLYIRDGIKMPNLEEEIIGELEEDAAESETFRGYFERRDISIPAVAGLCAGMKFINKAGINNIRNHELMLLRYLYYELNKIGYIKIYGGGDYENKSSMLSLNVDLLESSSTAYLLNKKEIAVKSGYYYAPLIHDIIGTKYRGLVRISPGYFNTIEDIEYLIDCLKSIYSYRYF